MDEIDLKAQEAIEELRNRIQKLDQDSLDLMFLQARTFYGWQDIPVSDEQLRLLYDILKMGPTSGNCFPIRIRFLRSKQAKERLLPHVFEGNRPKVMSAPVVLIIAHDHEFYEQIPKLMPHNPKRKEFVLSKPQLLESTAFRNGSLQGAYFIMAARAMGLDTGPMSGFNNAGVDKEFFEGTNIKSNFISNLGYGEVSSVFKRLPRLDFDEVCEIL